MKNAGLLCAVLFAVFGLCRTTAAHAETGLNSHRVALSTLLRTFLLPSRAEGSNPDWAVGAGPATPILWQDEGIVEASKNRGQGRFAYSRSGWVTVTVHGKPTHTVLGKTVQAGAWEITLMGPRGFVSKVSFAMDSNSQNFDLNLLQEFRAAHFQLSSVKCPKEDELASGGNAAFLLTSQGKKPAWLIENWSCGSAGCREELVLVYARAEAEAIECRVPD